MTFHDVFAAGASYYGIGDMEALARDTHKFESRYADRLVAPYPERLDVYRGALTHSFHRAHQLPVACPAGPRRHGRAQGAGGGDGRTRCGSDTFRTPTCPLPGRDTAFGTQRNIARSLEAELSFYAQVFGFQLADSFEPVEVEFLTHA